jgi:nicotinate-nucleotide adenylyltransferase
VAETRPVGILGGTFDPIHLGHLRLAEEMADALGLSEVRFVPAGQPPHRAPPRSAAADRLQMVRLATAGNPRFVVDAREVRAARPSYTVDTLADLRAELGPARPLVLLLGVDAFCGLPTWHDWRRLFEFAHIAVGERPGTAGLDAAPAALRAEIDARRAVSPGAAAGSVRFVATTLLDISATAIRDRLARGHSVRYLTPDAVLDHIHLHRLYTQP